jgi:uncharacterized protein
MSRSLTGWYDPGVLGSQGALLTGDIQFSALTRFCELIETTAGSVTARFQFQQKQGQCVTVEIQYQAAPQLVCQRCLEPFTMRLAQTSMLALIEPGDSEDYAPEGYEPFLMEEPKVQPVALLEDELIMALPLVARHFDKKDCGPLAERVTRLNSE